MAYDRPSGPWTWRIHWIPFVTPSVTVERRGTAVVLPRVRNYFTDPPGMNTYE
jgi:hypothetical protein